jgi:hypothetical protein
MAYTITLSFGCGCSRPWPVHSASNERKDRAWAAQRECPTCIDARWQPIVDEARRHPDFAAAIAADFARRAA